MSLQFVKLGGSLITDKTGEQSLERATLDRLAAEVAAAQTASPTALVVGHGSGSFGHVAAARTALRAAGAASPDRPIDRPSATEVSEVQAAAHRLHAEVLKALRAAGVAAMSLPPSSWLTLQDGKVANAGCGAVAQALELGLVPVVCGDVVLDSVRGAVICSTEEVFSVLVRGGGLAGRFTRALWMGRTDGLLVAGKRLDRIDETNVESALAEAGGALGVDVTGGMRHRVETLWSLAGEVGESWILDGGRPGVLEAALGGRRLGGTCVGRAEPALGRPQAGPPPPFMSS